MMWVGSLYITGNIQTYAESYYKVSATAVSICLPTIYALNAVFVFVLGKYTQRNVQPKLLIACGAVCGLGLWLAAIQTKSFLAFYLCYTFSFGLTTGFCYLITFHHTWLWFPNNKGLTSGICMGGYGVGALIFDNIMTPIMNPDNQNFVDPCFDGANYGCYPVDVDDNFQKMMYVLFGVWLLLALIGIICIFQGPLQVDIEVHAYH